MKKFSLTLLLCVSLLVAVPALADTVIGSPADTNTGNCYPFGCAYSGEYQQVYTDTAFSGPITITSLEFYNTAVSNFTGATGMNSGTFTISLSTTTYDWNSLSTTFATNIGADNTTVFTGSLAQPWAFGDTLTIDLTTPYTYNPGVGANLLMDIDVSGASNVGGAIYFNTNGYNSGGDNGNTIMGRVYCPAGVCGGSTTGTVDNGYGLVTGFNAGPTSTPEPSTLSLLLGSGLVCLLGIARRRLRQ